MDKAVEPNTIVLGDCVEVLRELPPDTFHLAITSPPYYNTRPEYSEWPSYGAYLADLHRWLCEIYRVLKPGRRLVWNVSNVPVNVEGQPKLLPLESDSIQRGLTAGFVLRNMIFWRDPADARLAEPGSFPNGPSVLLKEEVEYLIVFQKPAPAGHRPNYEKLSPELAGFNVMDRAFYRDRVAHQVWNIHPVIKINQNGENTFGHPAPFPEELIEPCIRMWSRPNEIVLDPFMGSGTTAVSALKWQRLYFGCELNPEYLKLAQRRIARREMELLTQQIFLPGMKGASEAAA